MRLHHIRHFNLVGLAAIACALCLHAPRAHAQFYEPPQQSALSQQKALQGSLRGQVVTSKGLNPANVRIELRNSKGMTVSSVEADASGAFEIGNLEAGSYEVIATSGVEQTAVPVGVYSLDTPITIRLASDSPATRGQAAVSMNSLRVPEGAEKAFEAANRLLPQKDMAGAWKQLDKALKACPKFAAALTLRGVLKMYSNQPQEAVADFAAALQADRSYGLAYVGLASDYNLMGRFDDALRVLDQASSQTPPTWQTHLETSKALLGKGIFDRALQHANQSASMLGHDFAMLNLVKAQAYLGLKDRTSAGVELRRYLDQDSSGKWADKARALLAETAK